jgi:hypothetical protein
MDGNTVPNSPVVTASLNYLVPLAGKPFSYTYPPPAGTPWRSPSEAHTVAIADGRRRAGSFSLDREGFELRHAPIAVRDLYDDAELRRVYYPACAAIVQAATGATAVHVFDHTIRSGREDQRKAQGLREPVTRVHNDYTDTSGPRRVRDLFPAEEAERLLQGRYAFINVWRPIRGPLQDHPLALCDARTIAPSDWIASDLIYRDRIGETYAVKFNPSHRWYYFSNMQRDEVVLIKCFDALTDGTARFSAHTAFADPTTPADAPPRESIEIRTMAFWLP